VQAFMLFFHVILAIVIFGALTAVGRLFAALTDRPKEEALAAMRLASRVERILGPVSLIVPIIGLGLVFSSNELYKLSQAWVWLSLALYAAAAAIGPGVALKTEDRLIGKLEASPAGATARQVAPDEVKKLQLAELALWVLLVALLALMVWRPGASFNISDLGG